MNYKYTRYEQLNKKAFIDSWNAGANSKEMADKFNCWTVTMVNRFVHRLRIEGYELKHRKTNGEFKEEER
jgi:hypothetical protein